MTDRLEQLAAIPPRTKAAKIRAFMPAIEQRISDGVSHQAIVAWLAEGGIEVTLATFKSYLQRYRREAQTLPRRVTPIPAQIPALGDTERNTVTDSKPMADDNPSSDLPETEPDTVAANSLTLADILDPKKSEARSDQYFNRLKPLFGRNRDKL
jgi:hypothetical protein